MAWCVSLGRDFSDGYRSIMPYDEGFELRELLYELHHQLNHYNLVGVGYLSSAKSDLHDLKRSLDSIE